MQLPFASEEEIKQEFTAKQAVLEAEAQQEREEKQGKVKELRTVRRAGAHYSDDAAQAQGAEDGELQNLEIEEYGSVFQFCQTQFFTSCPPVEFFEYFVKELEK